MQTHNQTSSAYQSTDFAALILRVALGAMFLAHGLYLKVFVFTLAGTAQFFGSIGFPPELAYLTALGETVIGAMLVLGIGVRSASLVSLPILLGATYVHLGNGWLFSAEGGGWEYPVFLIVAAIVQALLGAGAYAVKIPLIERLEARFLPLGRASI